MHVFKHVFFIKQNDKNKKKEKNKCLKMQLQFNMQIREYCFHINNSFENKNLSISYQQECVACVVQVFKTETE